MTQYRAVYCGLCHTLSKRYGLSSRLLVNYDFVLPAMLFWSGPCETVRKRCTRHPFRKHCHVCQNAALDYAADALMLFTDWKLRDSVSDVTFAPLARLILRFYRRKFRKAAGRLPEEADICVRRMEQLKRLEKERDARWETAAAFGEMLAALSLFYPAREDRRAAYSLFVHLGRWITAADAVDDQKRDRKTGAYNAATASGLTREAVFAMMGREQELALSAFDLLPENAYTEITRNILSLGLRSRGHELYTKGGAVADEGPV